MKSVLSHLLRRESPKVLTRRRSRRFTAASLLTMLAGTALMAGCDVHGASEPGSLSTLQVAPTSQTLAINETRQFTAAAKDFAGVALSITPTWTVVSGGGSINAAGMFTAGTVPGTYTNTVQATSGSLSSTATIIVTAGPLATITVTPSPDTLSVNGVRQYVAVGRDVAGNVVPITPTWSVTNGGGAIASATGLFTAGTVAGSFANTIRATSGTISGSASVVVTPGALSTLVITPTPVTLGVTATQQFVATGRDAAGNAIVVLPVWSVVSGGGTIGASTGIFTAGSLPGAYANTVRATVGGTTATASVTVTAGALSTITVAPNPATLNVSGTQQFVATGRDVAGNTVAITPLWSVANGGGSIVAATGLFTAGSTTGTFTNTIVATVGSITGSATVTVSAVIATISVTPNPATVVAGGTQTFVAVARDAQGNVVAGLPLWSVVNGGGTIVSSSGVFTAGTTAGNYTNTVRATIGAITGTATVDVTPGALATIVVTPNPDTTVAGGTKHFIAVGRDANNNIVVMTPTWSVANGGGAISASGVFTAGLAVGTYAGTIRATSGAISGSATEVVVAPSLASITVAPISTTLATNGTQQFVAIGRDQNGNPIAITPVWSVVNGGGAIFSNTGLFTAGVITGTYANTVRATSGSVSGTASVTVVNTVPPPLVDLGAAAPNGIMAGTAVTCVTGGLVSADVSVSPGNTLTGFGPCVITGVQNLANANAAQAQLALTSAYNALAGMACPPANAIVANLGGTTKAAGVYCTASGIGVTGTLTLNGGGDPNATFVFQAGTGLTTAGNIVLINGAQAKNVYWQVGTSATLGTASQWQGNILALTSITLVDNATLIGRALARNGAVTLGTNNVITLP